MLFFCGYKMAPKRYTSYFKDLPMTFDPTTTENKEPCEIMTHSVGLVRAILFCLKNDMRPTKIIAMDPPDSSPEAIMARFDTLPPDLKPVYAEFLAAKPNLKEFNIVCWRNAKNRGFSDHYASINYYELDTHYPYENKKLRDDIMREIGPIRA